MIAQLIAITQRHGPFDMPEFIFPRGGRAPAAPVTLRDRRAVTRVTGGTDESLSVSATYLRRDYGSL